MKAKVIHLGIWQINRTYRNLHRMQHIMNVLLKHGFGQLVRQIGLLKLLPLGRQASTLKVEETEIVAPISLPTRFRLVLEDLGPTFIKFGQVLSSRPDLIPDEFISELKKLREEVTPLPFPAIRRQIDQELEHNFDAIFSEVEETPLAAASIGQVHSAVLSDGTKVVVKVMRPGIEKIIRNDLDILYLIARLLEKHIPELRRFDPDGLVREFEKTIFKELDFTIEALNTERFRNNFKDDPAVVVPKIFWEISRKHVLVQEKIHGAPIDNFDKLEAFGLDKAHLAREGMRIFLRQVLEFGFFHADPHPGNVLVLPDGRIGLLDFGMVGYLDPHGEENLSTLIISIIHHDYDAIISALGDLGVTFDDDMIPQLRRELQELIETYYGLPLQRIGLSDVISRLIHLSSEFGITIPSYFLMLSRAMVVAEGVGRQLDPDIDIFAIGQPMIADILKRKSSPRKVASDSLRTLMEIKRVAAGLPNQLNSIMKKLIRGRIRIEFAHVGLEPLSKELERLGNRLVFGMVIAALILGSSIIMMADKGPLLFGYPMPGIIGFFLAGVIGLWLLFSILRSGRF